MAPLALMARCLSLLVGVGSLAACAVTPDPLTDAEKVERMRLDQGTMFVDTQPVVGPLGLDEAMARAIKYNLDRRVEVMSAAVADAQLNLGHYDLLPKLTAAAGYTSRNNEDAASSISYKTRQESLEPSFSQERAYATSQLTLSWNVLDFGVSYIRAKQSANRVLIVEEQRRKVVHNIIQDVRYAYWRSVAAERLLGPIERLVVRVEAALEEARALERDRVRAPLEELQYQRALLATLEGLKALRGELIGSKAQLAALMSLPPGTEYEVVIPAGPEAFQVPRLDATPDDLERIALFDRPELNELSYQQRISHAETHRILLELLPGIDLSTGGAYTSNQYTVNALWAFYGVGAAWNIMNLISAPARLEVAEADENLVEMKRAALSMAVMAQVDVAWLRYRQAIDEFGTAREQARVEQGIHEQMLSAEAARRIGELDVIQAEADSIFGQLRRDIAYANLQNAYGAIMVSMGTDPLPSGVRDDSLPALSEAIGVTFRSWEDGTALASALERMRAAEPETAAETPGPGVSPSDPSGSAPTEPAPAISDARPFLQSRVGSG